MSALDAALGFVGVGNMGGAMARRVLSQGGAVVASDTASTARERLAEAGATIAATPREVAEACRTVSVVVNTDDQVREAVLGENGVLAGSKKGTIIAIHSTIHLSTLEAVAAAAGEHGVEVIDAAVTGGVEAAERGELAVLLGGSASSADAARPALGQYASLVMHAGGLGSGMAAKLAIMVVTYGKLASAYEGLLLAHAAGVDPVELARVIAHSEAQSGITTFYPKARAEAFLDPGPDQLIRQIGIHEGPKAQKDLHAALELAERLTLDLPLARAAHNEMPASWGLEP